MIIQSAAGSSPDAFGVHLVILRAGSLMEKMGQFGSFSDFWRKCSDPGDSLGVCSGPLRAASEGRRGQATVDPGVSKLLGLHLKQGPLFYI